jgi:hypothetical protein
MRNYRFYIPNISSKNVKITDEGLLHKMNNVLRLTKDSCEDIEFFDGKGNIIEVELTYKPKKFQTDNTTFYSI